MNNPRPPSNAEQEGLLSSAFHHDGAAQSLVDANLPEQAFPNSVYYALYRVICQEQQRHTARRLSSLQVLQVASPVIQQLAGVPAEGAAAFWSQIIDLLVEREDVHPLIARFTAWGEHVRLQEEAKEVALMSEALATGHIGIADYARSQRKHAARASRVAAFQPGLDPTALEALFERSLATDDTVATGFVDWDNLISLSYPGGLALGSLNTVAGDTGYGKTTMMMSLLHGLLVRPKPEDKVATAYVNFEVSDHEFLRSLFGVFMGVHPLVAARRGEYATPEGSERLSLMWVDFKRVLTAYLKDRLFEFRRWQTYQVEDIEHYVRLRAGDGFQVFIIDTVNRVMDEEARQSRHEEIQSVVYKLERLAHDLHVSVVLAAQHNREKHSRRDKRPVLCDIAGSQAIEHSSHSVSQLYRADLYDGAEHVELHVTKSRARGAQRDRTVKLRYCPDRRIYVPIHEQGTTVKMA